MITFSAATLAQGPALGNGLLTLIAILVTAALSSPVMVSVFQARAIRRDRIQDMADRDRVAIKAAEVAANLLSTNATVARTTVASNAEHRKALQAIHVLVNSNLLAAQRSELVAVQASLKAMREVVALKTRLGVPVLKETQAALEAVEGQVAALALDIVYKEQATLLAETIILDHKEHKDPTLATEDEPLAS